MWDKNGYQVKFYLVTFKKLKPVTEEKICKSKYRNLAQLKYKSKPLWPVLLILVSKMNGMLQVFNKDSLELL